MYLDSYSVRGFRSLAQVTEIPVSRPTVLAGRNDGGKSAVLTALAFLLGAHRLTDEDRTYVRDEEESSGRRCAETWVEGQFRLDADEQADSGLGEHVRIRRRSRPGETTCLEYFGSQPTDPQLRDLHRLLKPALTKLVAEYGLSPAGNLKEDLLAKLTEHAKTVPQDQGWQPLPKTLEERLPRLLSFGGKDESPDNAVRTALNSSYKTHLEDETLQGRVREIEEEINQRLEKEADSLCRHIRQHCAEYVNVNVKPMVSFSGGFKGAPLHVSRADGEPVDLTRAGQGSARRIALAVWEWTSNLLENAELAASGEPASAQPTQTIVVYDEPDTHLDYHHQRTVMDIVRKQCALPHVNVMVATHSMNLIDGVDIADVVHLSLGPDGRTVVERLKDDQHDGIDFHLGQIAASLGLRNSVLLHERCFLAVEGDTEQQSLPLLFRLAQNMSLQAAGIALWGCENNEGALHLASYLVKHQRTVMLMIDADSRTNKLLKDERLRRAGLDLTTQVSYVGEADGYNELEELFSDKQWATAANALWPRPAPQAWRPEDFEAHRDGKKFSARILGMIKQEAEDKSPNGKPAMVYGLASTLTAPEDVPRQLREIFTRLQELAH
ncbi:MULTISPECIES: ATP-dependent nuclease [Streptomyces]|uniref:Recombination protein F n=1 Tax=Streptomyces rubrolavendulae TaxID=285473 RepID=A0A1D8GB02_9ACTN|nr:ATP-binding protein [Streptomyces rubrolavendulae]AOT57238.1 recombination protein F [Streptomyces rubrolavendulae]AOT62631.1 recombination protein F [Streptomyces rubrolavendulae]